MDCNVGPNIHVYVDDSIPGLLLVPMYLCFEWWCAEREQRVGQITPAGRVGRSPLFRNNDRSASYARYEYWRVNAMKGKYLESPVTRVDSIVVDVQRQSTRPIRCPIRWPMFCRLLRHVDLQRSLNVMYHELVYPFPFFFQFFVLFRVDRRYMG